MEGIGIIIKEDVGGEESKHYTFFAKDVRRSSGECLRILRVYSEHHGSMVESKYVACWAMRKLGEGGRKNGIYGTN